MSVIRSIRSAQATNSLAAVLLLGLLTAPALAHHSFAMFDRATRVTLMGTVTAFEWTNPHSYIKFDVPGKDENGAAKVTHYLIECGSPSVLANDGWKFSDFKPGDQLTLVINPLKDGRPGGSFVKATFANGRVIEVPGLPPGAALPRV